MTVIVNLMHSLTDFVVAAFASSDDTEFFAESPDSAEEAALCLTNLKDNSSGPNSCYFCKKSSGAWRTDSFWELPQVPNKQFADQFSVYLLQCTFQPSHTIEASWQNNIIFGSLCSERDDFDLMIVP